MSRNELTLFDGAIDLCSAEVQSEQDRLFDAFWDEYPRRVDKKAARRAFDRVIKRKEVSFRELIEGVVRYSMERSIQDPLAREPQFTKHPATWLNNQSWLNEPRYPNLEHRVIDETNDVIAWLLATAGDDQ